MPINKLALVRYKTIDNCLQNRFRKWTLEDLMEACSEALYEYEGIDKGVSRRTIQLDLQTMRSEKLGYNAPILVIDKKYYTYEDKKYSITNIPLTSQDLGTLSEVVGVLKQFKGFGYFKEISDMVSKLEDRVYKQQHKGKSFISFETNDLLKGLEFIDPLHKAVMESRTLEVSYQSFKAREATPVILYPYLLKEHRNRWFILGANQKNKVLTLALDRIVAVKELPGEKYVKNSLFDINTYFDDAIGVTKTPNQPSCMVVMKTDRLTAQYIKTKPLHRSQKVLKEENGEMIFSIQVVWNFELERELLGFGESIHVLSPRKLASRMKSRLKQALENYTKERTESKELDRLR